MERFKLAPNWELTARIIPPGGSVGTLPLIGLEGLTAEAKLPLYLTDDEAERLSRWLRHLARKARATRLGKLSRAYVECILWAESPPDSDRSLSDCEFTVDSFSAEAFEEIVEDCETFETAADAAGLFTEDNDRERAGHDFWLTRNRHGAGFWDGDWPEPGATTLTNLSHDAGEVYLYVSDAGELEFGR